MSNPVFFRVIVFTIALILYQNLDGQNTEFDLNAVKESIQIETDRDLYFSGEEIFFSAQYFINQLKVNPVISEIIYIELINCMNNNSVIQKKYKLNDFNASGSITIPQNIKTGNYVLRAYTQYQRNFSAVNYSYHFLTILNPEDKENILKTYKDDDSIVIAPEGNMLLDNVKNKVVIKVPIQLVANDNRYFILDEASHNLENVMVSDKGFFRKEFAGEFSHSYYFLIVKSNGDTVSAAFPKISQYGIQTQTQFFDSFIKYNIKIKDKNIVNQESKYLINVLCTDFTTVYKKEIAFSGNTFEIQIPSEKLNNGINYLVLTDTTGNITQINSVFIQSKKIDSAELTIDKEQLEKREVVGAHFTLDGNILENSPIISISVTKHKTKKVDYNFNPSYLNNSIILNDYLLSSYELDDEILSQIMILYDKAQKENLLEEIVKGAKTPTLEYIPEINDVTISGIIRNRNTLNPVENHKIYASLLFNNPQLHVSKSNKNGQFIVVLNNVSGTNSIFLCPEKIDDGEYEILISNSFSNEMPMFSDVLTFVNDSDRGIIDDLFVNAQINNYFESKSEKILLPKKPSHKFNIDNNKSTAVIADFVSLKNMEELFTEIIPTVKYRRRSEKYTFSVFDANGNIFSEEPLVLLDKIPVFDISKIMKLDIALIEKVEVINSPYILGENTFQGVVMISTKTDNFAGIKFPVSSVFIEYPTVEPMDGIGDDFVKFKHENARLPDFRTTLYWDSNIKLNSNIYDFKFVTSDSKGVYDIEITGFTRNGNKIYCKKQISVN